MLKIITVPDPLLRQKAKPVVKIEPEISSLIAGMLSTLNGAGNPDKGIVGVGLAAPQIGSLTRVILARKVKGRSEQGEVKVLINPEILKASQIKELGIEGCLSVPDTYGQVERARWIKVKALNERGRHVGFKAEGFFARIIQHEIDHLDGILFTDKVVGRLYRPEELSELPAE